MPIELTPAAWLGKLDSALNARWCRPRTGMGVADAYFEGDHRLAFATVKFREAFGALFATIADNWMPMVVDASRERLEVQGFRYGRSQGADDIAWDMWQANGLDAEANMVHEEAIKLGEAYWMVQPPRANGDAPRITAEHPSQVIVACDPSDRRRRLAALKKWIDDDGYLYANVYLPRAVYKYRSQEKPRGGHRVQWVRRTDDPGGLNPLGAVPIIPVRNAPSMTRGGRSDLTVAIPIQDALNKLLSDMLVGSEYQAFPQRVLIGVEAPVDPATGQPTTAAQLQASQSRAWFLSNENAKILNAKTRVPPYYTSGEIVNASGDALKIADTNLTSKVRDKMPSFGESHEETMSLAFRAIGDDERANVRDAEVIWRDPETRSEAQVVDAAVKLQGLGVPDEILFEGIGYSPQKIARIMEIRETQALLDPVPPVVPVVDAAAA